LIFAILTGFLLTQAGALMANGRTVLALMILLLVCVCQGAAYSEGTDAGRASVVCPVVTP
jgi:hypothetical protein